MKNEKLFTAIGKIDDKLIENAVNYDKKVEKSIINKISLVAAVIVLLLGSIAIYKMILVNNRENNKNKFDSNVNKNSNIADSNNKVDGIYIPKVKLDVSEDEKGMSDSLAICIYQGSCYINYQTIKDNGECIDKYIATVTSRIEEDCGILPDIEDDYYEKVELSGSLLGDYYSIKGLEPSFALAMKYGDESKIFINNNGLTLKYGADIFKDKVNMLEEFYSIGYNKWNVENSYVGIENVNEKKINQLINDIYSSEFFLIDENDSNYDIDNCSYMFTITTKNKVEYDFWIYEDGVIRYNGIYEAGLKIDKDLLMNILGII